MSEIISLYEKKLEKVDDGALMDEAAFCGELMERAAHVRKPLTPSEMEWCRAVFQAGFDRSKDDHMKLIYEAALRVLPFLA